jgi:hypothetical protein
VDDPDPEAAHDHRLERPVDAELSAQLPDLLPALGDLTGFLLAAETVEDVLGRVVVTARHAIPGADLVSITIRDDDGGLETPTGTGPEAAELDQAQYRAGIGPCVDAADPDGPAYALSNNLANEAAWQTFAASATAHGYASVLSTALLSGPEPVPFTGALNIYSRELNRFDDSARDLAFLLATHASLALVAAHTRQSLADAEYTIINLRRAIDSHTIIGQATGILMSRRKLTADQAFDVLKQTSQNRNIKMARLAELLTDEPGIADRL